MMEIVTTSQAATCVNVSIDRPLCCVKIPLHFCACHSYPHFVAIQIACGKGSAANCRADPVALQGPYSAGKLIRVTNGLKISKSADPNSCPKGWKLWSPQSQQDWQTAKDSTTLPAAPHMLVDVTRAANGCGGCNKYAMKSSVPEQSS